MKDVAAKSVAARRAKRALATASAPQDPALTKKVAKLQHAIERATRELRKLGMPASSAPGAPQRGVWQDPIKAWLAAEKAAGRTGRYEPEKSTPPPTTSHEQATTSPEPEPGPEPGPLPPHVFIRETGSRVWYREVLRGDRLSLPKHIGREVYYASTGGKRGPSLEEHERRKLPIPKYPMNKSGLSVRVGPNGELAAQGKNFNTGGVAGKEGSYDYIESELYRLIEDTVTSLPVMVRRAFPVFDEDGSRHMVELRPPFYHLAWLNVIVDSHGTPLPPEALNQQGSQGAAGIRWLRGAEGDYVNLEGLHETLKLLGIPFDDRMNYAALNEWWTEYKDTLTEPEWQHIIDRANERQRRQDEDERLDQRLPGIYRMPLPSPWTTPPDDDTLIIQAHGNMPSYAGASASGPEFDIPTSDPARLVRIRTSQRPTRHRLREGSAGARVARQATLTTGAEIALKFRESRRGKGR